MSTDLPYPDHFHLRAAHGWLELGNPGEAIEELKRVTPARRAHPDILELRWHIHAHQKDWDACVEVAAATIAAAPRRAEPWIHRSFALHELKRTQEAYERLLPGADRFPDVWTIPYNLACYCAQLGRIEDSQAWLKKAMAIDADTVKQAAKDDPDLQPLRDRLGGQELK